MMRVEASDGDSLAVCAGLPSLPGFQSNWL